jgi:Protein of unknown function (DUF2946)
MDDIVKAAMAKWPNVPDCYGWLALDARGHWYMRDDRTQQVGPFAGPGATPASKGAVLKHDKLIEFIHRNYEHDASGRWFFQNGPQRVYVELEAAPLVWRLSDNGTVRSHTGQVVQVRSTWLDEMGRLYLDTDLGLGLVHTQDMHLAAEWVEQGRWVPQECLAAELPQRFGFVSSPQSEAAGCSA